MKTIYRKNVCVCFGYYLAFILLITASITSKVFAQPQLTAKEHINNRSMLEAMANGYYMIQQEFGLDPASTITWTATYSETGWTGSITGTLYNKPLTINYTAATVYDTGQNATCTFSATGANDTQAITINGSALWNYSSGLNRYITMSYQDSGTVETPKISWKKRLLEIFGGGIAGGLVEPGIGGIVSGIQIAWELSNKSENKTTDGTTPPVPPAPSQPSLPLTVNEALTYCPNGTEVVVLVTGNGKEIVNVQNQVILIGTWANGLASGSGRIGLTCPTLPQWGLIILGVVLLTLSVVHLRKRRRQMV